MFQTDQMVSAVLRSLLFLFLNNSLKTIRAFDFQVAWNEEGIKLISSHCQELGRA